MVNRLSFLRGSRSDYLLRRLPDRRELARRAYALPLLLILATLGTMVLVLAVYYAVYLALTPPECLQPNQLGKLWDNFGYLFTPTMKGGYPDAGMQTPHQSLPRQGPGPWRTCPSPSPGGRSWACWGRTGRERPPS